jgi:hypothetical protein
LKIARLYLEDDDPVQAEAFINRASLLQVYYHASIWNEPEQKEKLFLGRVKRQAAADLLQSLLCQSAGLQTQIH